MKNEVFDRYFGGKNGSGVAQQIINQIRPHDRYYELFGGSGAVMQLKKPAHFNGLSDKDPAVYQKWRELMLSGDPRWKFPKFCAWNRCAIELIRMWLEEKYIFRDEDTKHCIYLDPPYPLTSRRSPKKVYAHEMTDQEHMELLSLVRQVPSNVDVIISTYPNPIYEEMLSDWRVHSFQAQTRRGPATELLYMNYENPSGELHQYDFLGEDFTDRQRIKRKIARQVRRLEALPASERQAIIAAISDIA